MVVRTTLAAGLAVVIAVAVAACGGGSAGSTGRTLTPGGGRNATGPPIATHPSAPRTVPVLIPPAGAPAHSVKVPVLTYHRVVPAGAVGQLDLKVDPANFLAELQAIKAAGFHTITQAQLFDALYRGRVLPAKPVLLSFDDGYVDDIRTILPDLVRLHMVGTFFVITGRMAEPGFLTADQIRALDVAGMDIGDHTAHHVDLRLLDAAQLRAETRGSRRALQRVLQHFVYSFAYPFGATNPTVQAAVRAAGYTLAYTTAGGETESTTAPLAMPRIHVGRSETPAGLVALLGG
jgi:peptidoglycan/xylan/chitin deacetylase (PgdA/CDA1 family)